MANCRAPAAPGTDLPVEFAAVPQFCRLCGLTASFNPARVFTCCHVAHRLKFLEHDGITVACGKNDDMECLQRYARKSLHGFNDKILNGTKG